jgi:hypothetical protein
MKRAFGQTLAVGMVALCVGALVGSEARPKRGMEYSPLVEFEIPKGTKNVSITNIGGSIEVPSGDMRPEKLVLTLSNGCKLRAQGMNILVKRTKQGPTIVTVRPKQTQHK